MITLSKPTTEKLVYREPERHALILQVMPGAGGILLKIDILHVLIYHGGVHNEAEARTLIDRAVTTGKAVVRVGVKDMIETLLADCNRCDVCKASSDFRFVSELN